MKRFSGAKRHYSSVSKKCGSGGPGGWHCPCCNKYGCSPRKMKPKVRRTARRIMKQQLDQE